MRIASSRLPKGGLKSPQKGGAGGLQTQTFGTHVTCRCWHNICILINNLVAILTLNNFGTPPLILTPLLLAPTAAPFVAASFGCVNVLFIFPCSIRAKKKKGKRKKTECCLLSGNKSNCPVLCPLGSCLQKGAVGGTGRGSQSASCWQLTFIFDLVIKGKSDSLSS